MPFYEFFKKLLKGNNDFMTKTQSCIAGCAAGVIAGILTNPIDVIKSNIMG